MSSVSRSPTMRYEMKILPELVVKPHRVGLWQSLQVEQLGLFWWDFEVRTVETRCCPVQSP